MFSGQMKRCGRPEQGDSELPVGAEILWTLYWPLATPPSLSYCSEHSERELSLAAQLCLQEKAELICPKPESTDSKVVATGVWAEPTMEALGTRLGS